MTAKKETLTDTQYREIADQIQDAAQELNRLMTRAAERGVGTEIRCLEVTNMRGVSFYSVTTRCVI